MRLDYAKIKILQDAFSSLLNNEFLADIKFKFADGRVIFAHSFVLCCRSDEFCDSFEATVGVSKLIEVQNFNYEDYFEFLKFLYTDACEIDESNSKGVIELSRKHELAELESKCIDAIIKDLSVVNACSILQSSIELELESLRIKTTEFIAKNYLTSLNSESFLKIREEALQIILELDTVSDVNEFKIFEATIKWSEHECLKDGLESSGSLKREKLGGTLKLLRFGAMSHAEFTACNELEPGLLTNEEIISIYINLSTGKNKNNSFGFPYKKRLQLDLREIAEVLLFDKDIWPKINSEYILASCDHKITFSTSHSISIENIIWRDNTGIQMIRLIRNLTTIYENPDLTDFFKSKQLLEANTHYTFYVTYTPMNRFYLKENNTSFKLKSKCGKCEFTIYQNSSALIRKLIFKV